MGRKHSGLKNRRKNLEAFGFSHEPVQNSKHDLFRVRGVQTRGFLRRSDRRHVAGELSGPVFVFSPDPSVFTQLQKKELRLFEADQVGKQEGNLSLVDFFFFFL